MGGKSFFCDYCRCFMKNNKNVRKTHNEGLQHKIVKTSFLRRYEDPRKLYEEEVRKQKCVRYFKGYCKYDLYCQFTHFNEAQLKQLKEITENLETKARQNQTFNQNFTIKSKKISKLPWQNTLTKHSLKLLPSKLPPSLRPLNLSKLSLLNVKINKWGP